MQGHKKVLSGLFKFHFIHYQNITFMQQLSSFAKWEAYSLQNASPAWQGVLDYEMELNAFGSETQIFERLQALLRVQFKAVEIGLTENKVTCSGIIQNGAKKVMSCTVMPLGEAFNKVMAYAMAAKENNACGGRVVGAPTAGASGILPAIFYYMHKDVGFTKEEIYKAMLIAAGVGLIVEKRASISGAAGGCQAETGTAAAMGAAAMVYLYGGGFKEMGIAVKTVFMNMMGLICDPIEGKVEMPCVQRNSNAVLTAFGALVSGMSGFHLAFLETDDVIDTMDEVGKTMSRRYKETAEGGVATARKNRKSDADLRQTNNSVFDIYGPAMIGPSTSHTCGANRIAQFAKAYLGCEITTAYVTLYNSFALTGEGHGTDRAIIAGLLGMKEDNLNLHNSHEIARAKGLHFEIFKVNENYELHENTTKIVAMGSGKTVEIIGISTGGGIISIVSINEMGCEISCQKDTLIADLHESANLDPVLSQYKETYSAKIVETEKGKCLIAFANEFPKGLIAKVKKCAAVNQYTLVKRIY
jgi:L-serine dehydratase